VFKTSDGYITAAPFRIPNGRGSAGPPADPELAKDPRFSTPSARSVNATARINKMAEYIAQHSTAEWLERLDAADVPCAPILRRGEIIHNEQVVARDIITEFDQPMSDVSGSRSRRHGSRSMKQSSMAPRVAESVSIHALRPRRDGATMIASLTWNRAAGFGCLTRPTIG